MFLNNYNYLIIKIFFQESRSSKVKYIFSRSWPKKVWPPLVYNNTKYEYKYLGVVTFVLGNLDLGAF
jgi:hypothetical protein